MVCFHPITAFLPFDYDSDGKRRLIFKTSEIDVLYNRSRLGKVLCSYDSISNCDNLFVDSTFHLDGLYKGALIKVPCGKCIGCKMTNARRWSFRSYHEGYMHNHFKDCCFLTLTFNNEQLYKRVVPFSLNKIAFRSFIKRMREKIRYYYGVDIRYLACGEYGSKNGRPHYHMLIYGFNFPDKYLFRGRNCPESLRSRVVNGQLYSYYRSPFLESLWSPPNSNKSYGFSVIGNMNFETCAYVSRYVLKKCKSSNDGREDEFILTSRMPGLGYSYFENHYRDICANGFLQLPTGHKCDIPRFYFEKLKVLDIDLYNKLVLDKKQILLDNLFTDDIDCTEGRLLAREQCLNVKLDKYVRNYEFDSNLHNIYS